MTDRPDVPVREVRWSGHSDRGKVRVNNEDCFLGLRFDGREVQRLGKLGEAPTGPHDFVFAVSDGMGGARAGEFAARITVDKIVHLLPPSFRQQAAGVEAGSLEIIAELFNEIDQSLKAMGRSYAECCGMGATLSLCWFTAEWLYFGHIGDSRIYYLERGVGDLKQLSHDDTHIGWLQRNGKISEREARLHPRRTALQKALGSDYQFTEPQVGAVFLQAGDIFFLCTDGLNEGLFNSQIHDALRGADQGCLPPASALVDAAVQSSGRDNTTAMVIQLL